MDDLLERLGEDRHRPAIARLMTDLLLRSFFPASIDAEAGGANGASGVAVGDQRLSRCLQFVERAPLAAEAFYAHVHRYVAVGSVANFTQRLFAHLLTAQAQAQATVFTDPSVPVDGTVLGSKVAGGKSKRRRNQKVSIRSVFSHETLLVCVSQSQ